MKRLSKISSKLTSLHWTSWLGIYVFAAVIAAAYSARDGLRAKEPPVVIAILRGNHSKLSKLLDEGYDPNEKSPNGETPIFLAIKMGRYDLANELIEHGADLEVKNSHGQTILDHAKSTNNKTAIAWITHQLLRRTPGL